MDDEAIPLASPGDSESEESELDLESSSSLESDSGISSSSDENPPLRPTKPLPRRAQAGIVVLSSSSQTDKTMASPSS